MSTLVVGFNDSDRSRAALDWAVDEAEIRGDKLHVVRALEEMPSEGSSRAARWAQRLEDAREMGNELVASLEASGLEVDFNLEGATAGDPATVLVHHANNLEARLLVIGMRRRSRVGKLVLGSIAQDVLLRATCPVVAVKRDGT